MAIDGPLEGTRLDLIPASVTPWPTWLKEHPETLVLDAGKFARSRSKELFSPDYVIGIALGEYAKGYPFRPVSEDGLINDRVGPYPIVVVADAETKAVHAYVRKTRDEELDFTIQESRLIDIQTGSTWDVSKGVAVDGPLRGEVLQQVPYITAFSWAWQSFYPHTEIYKREK